MDAHTYSITLYFFKLAVVIDLNFQGNSLLWCAFQMLYFKEIVPANTLYLQGTGNCVGIILQNYGALLWSE